jgi:toxin CcdB
MARYDLYRNEREGIYLLDVQADLLDHLNTRVIVPLYRPMRLRSLAAVLIPLSSLKARNT